MSVLQDALLVELQTIMTMTQLYCRAHHDQSQGLCPACQALLEYAEVRLDRCPYGASKPACKHCPVHCYKPEPKQQIRQIMRYAGPRMLWHHPLLAIRHLRNEHRPFPAQPPEGQSNRAIRLAQTAMQETSQR